MPDTNSEPSGSSLPNVKATYRDYFLQYASYVITDRAIPDQADGLKPVQRRLLHSLWENEDGRYNKVANLVGHTMKYHPHGDASIYAALVALGQKGLLIDTQGNWGNPATNDPAAAARYIEARLTPFAKEVVFAPNLTSYQLSYDGRNQEPVVLPVRFPLLLALGAEGIAVGLTTRILPHNFCELLEAQIAFLRGRDGQIFPDFPTGGLMDVTPYKDGAPGSRVKLRARIESGGGKKLVIREIPYGVTTKSLIDSILAAREKGKIKVARVDDNSAAGIEVVVTFQRGVDMGKAMAALYAFTACEVSLAANGMVICDGRPSSRTVSQLLQDNALRTRRLLKLDLQLQRDRLEQLWHRQTLVQIFVENRVYRRIETSDTWPKILEEIKRGLKPHLHRLKRPVTEEDLVYLTEIRIKRISAWDHRKAREVLESIEAELHEVRKKLGQLTRSTIEYLQSLLDKYGAGHQRKTEITTFETVRAASVAERAERLFFDRRNGFLGTDPRLGEELGPCSGLDEVLVILADGTLLVTRVEAKKYVGEKIVHLQFFRPRHRNAPLHLIYEDRSSGCTYVKRFTVGGVTRDRRYPLGKRKTENSTRVLLVSADAKLCAHVRLRKKPRIQTDLYVDFQNYLIKGRAAIGNLLTRHKPSSARTISRRVYLNRVQQS